MAGLYVHDFQPQGSRSQGLDNGQDQRRTRRLSSFDQRQVEAAAPSFVEYKEKA